MGDSLCTRLSKREHIVPVLKIIQWASVVSIITSWTWYFSHTCIYSELDGFLKEKDTRNPVIVWGDFCPWVQQPTTIKCFNRKCDVIPICHRNVEGDAYLFYAYRFSGLPNLPLPRKKNTIWALLHEESPTKTLEFLFEKVLNIFNFSATFSRFSDVPFPLMWMESLETLTSLKYYVNTSMKNKFLQKNGPVVAVCMDCTTATDREKYIDILKQYITIDSYGKCTRNKIWPPNSSRSHSLEDAFSDQFMRFIARYKFFIAIENNVCSDYITEKLWRSLKIGVVPIYFGSPLIREWLPNNKSAILIDDYPTPELLSIHLRELLQNNSKYEEYLEHKTKGLISNKRLFEEIKARPYQTDMMQAVNKFQCLVCERLHDRDSTEVNVVTKKHYNCCNLPISVLTLSVNPKNGWVQEIGRKTPEFNEIYDNLVRNPNFTNSNKCLYCF